MSDVRHLLPCPITVLKTKLGRKSYARLFEVLSGKVRCPAELAPQIEAATNGAISRSDLRPDLWPPLNKVS
ncbi:MAG TPA: Cro/Cl family transcriptional regulator [Syntrophobacteraceae bacterium]|nr:Cro/Cl family transcriptional regulator [Syntrophobacteraceae bacterium]